LCIVAVIVLVILSLTVFFPVEKITVDSGNTIYTSEQIIKASGIKKGENLWMTGFDAEENIPVKLPFISEAVVERKFPSSIVIKTKPAKAVYCFKVKNEFYLCDNQYKVLAVKKERDESLTLISGSDVNQTKVGNLLSFTNDKKRNMLEKIFSLLSEKKIKLNSVDITELLEINIRVENRFTVHLGSSANFDSKISHLAGMLQKAYADVKGSIDLSDYTPENGSGILTRE